MKKQFTLILLLAGSLLALTVFLTAMQPQTAHALVATPASYWSFIPVLRSFYQSPPTPFMRAPFFGTWSMSCVFDHNLPDYGTHDDKITHYTNITSTDITKTGDITGTCYDGHSGYDYYSASRFDPVLAVANGTVSEAKWYNPSNHRSGLGLFVNINHGNTYISRYGHLSAATVDVGTQITIADNGYVIGTSGNTGNVSSSNGCDPNTNPQCAGHVHFEVQRNGIVVDPYGWDSATTDPWAEHQREIGGPNATSYNLWAEDSEPALVDADNGECTYPTGNARTQPDALPESWAIVVDDGDATYSETANCWTTSELAAGYGGDLRYATRVTDTATCHAQWAIPVDAELGGEYQVYAHLVAPGTLGQTTSQGAHYTIHHAGEDDTAILNQWAYTNPGHPSPWVYLGTYTFERSGDEYVALSDKTDDHDAERVVLADAVRFIPLEAPPATPTPTPTPVTPTSTPTITPTPTPVTPTPTPTLTPTPIQDTYEPNDTLDEAQPMGTDTWYESYIWTSSDHDFYTFLFPAEPSANVSIYLQSIPEGADYDLKLYDPDGVLLESSENSNNDDEIIRYYGEVYGYYYIEVLPYNDTSSQTDSYQVKVVTEISPNESGSTQSVEESLPAGLVLFATGEITSKETPATAVTSIAFDALVHPGCELLELVPSPDERYLAAQLSCEWGSYVLLAGGNKARRVSGDWGSEAHVLDWLPGDIPQIILRTDPLASGAILALDPRTLDAQPLPLPNTTYAVAVSPDGQQMLYATTVGLGHGSELWLLPSIDGQATRVRHEPEHILADPRWAPDGRQWAYIRMEDSAVPFTLGELWVGDAQSAHLLSRAADAGHGFAPVWSPDGQHVAFVGRENPDDEAANVSADLLVSNLYLADVTDGTSQAATRFDDQLVAEPLWEPGGSRLFFNVGARQDADVWHIDLATDDVQPLTHGAGAQLLVWRAGKQ